MGKQITKKVEKLELIKVEKLFNNPDVKQIYHYNLYLEGIEDPLIFSSNDSQLDTQIAGMKIKYRLSDENEVSEFEIL
jgi:hypothetical protein